MVISQAELDDLRSITEIYNEIVEHSTAIYRDTPATIEERTRWWKAQREKGYPILIAEEGGAILGFASFDDFRAWPGYRYTIEGTIHLRPEARRQGTGSILLQELIVLAKALGKHRMIAGVDSENTASLNFLSKRGFHRAGYLREVGYKFGRFLDLVLLEYELS